MDDLEEKFLLPKWAYLPSEWSRYILDKKKIENELRQMKVEEVYNNYEVIE